LPFEPVGKEWHREIGVLQCPTDDAVEAIADDPHIRANAPAEGEKSRETCIDANVADRCIERFRRHAQELHLAPHALACGDLARLPRRLHDAPQRISEFAQTGSRWDRQAR
jgi:hypothetical protein